MAKLIGGKPDAKNGKAPKGDKALWQSQFDAAAKLPGANDRTISDHPLKPMYMPEDAAGIDYATEVGYP
ncbi:MAG TPA: hypothetical protein VEV38_07445, partial [Candidatus Eremiobacteraceae bacterium]|nr:hypothetical protein [Candidatus Eremiobacteraceae bacterium]